MKEKSNSAGDQSVLVTPATWQERSSTIGASMTTGVNVFPQKKDHSRIGRELKERGAGIEGTKEEHGT